MAALKESHGAFVRMLGGLRVFLDGAPAPKFRSRTAERLLSRLALRLGTTVSKSEMSDLLWPDSDGDRQSQNLRRAIADVRQVLEQNPSAPVIVRTDTDHVWLDDSRASSDVALFRARADAGLEAHDEEDNLRAASEIYSGALLPEDEDPRLGIYRMELEELFAQVVERRIAVLLRSERFEEALRVGRHAVTIAPLREDIHVALMRAYASAGLRTEAIRQFEELEALLDDHWGEPPSAQSLQVLRDLGENQPSPVPPPLVPAVRATESAGGALPAGSPFYVARECDTLLNHALSHAETTILVHGSRQVGKTSLVGRVLNESRRSGTSVVVTDFQVFSRSQLAGPEAFSRAVAVGFATQTKASIDVAGMWNEWLGPNSNLDAVVEAALAQADGPVVWAMDETDRLFATEFADDFFGLVRSWHNRRAMDPDGPFRRLTLLIAYATEAHLFIRDINQSPFNVGVRIPLRDFGAKETRELALRYGATLTDAEIAQVVALTGGHPFLTRRSLDALVLGGRPLAELVGKASDEDGPFAEHLRRLPQVLERDGGTREEIVGLLRDQPIRDPKTAHRLVAGGILTVRADGSHGFRVPAYRDYLMRYLLAEGADGASLGVRQ